MGKTILLLASLRVALLLACAVALAVLLAWGLSNSMTKYPEDWSA